MKDFAGIETTWMLIGILMAALVGWMDFVTGYEFSFSIFYLIPVGVATWKSGRTGGIVVSVACAGIWLLVDVSLRSPEVFAWISAHVPTLGAVVVLGPAYASPLTPFWNAGVRLSFFLITTFLLVGRQEESRRKKRLPREF